MKAEDFVTFSSFMKVFWKECRQNPAESQYSIFLRMNECYRERFGEDRFVSFDAFRMRRDRTYKKKK